MSSSLTGLFGNALGDILSESLGLEPTDAELDARSDAAFARFDADASGALDFAEILAAFATMPIRALDPAVVRDVFDRFDADDSGTLDRAEFRAMMRALRSAANVDRMPGLIFCAGELANPSAHPELAERMRLERLYRTPYRPRSALAKAIAKKTKMNKPVYGGIDLLELSVLTEDSDEELLRCSDEDEDSAAGGGRAPRARARDVGVGAAPLKIAGGHTSRRFKKGHAAHSSRRYASSRRKKLAYLALCALRFACLVLPGYVHPDEYHQSVEIAAADVLGARAAPRAWEFDEAAPARSALVPGLAAAWPLAIARETARFAEALLERTREDSREVPPLESKNTTPAPLTLFGPHASLVVFLAPRLGLFALSFALDWCAALGAKAAYWARGGKTTWRGGASAGLDARLCVASAWPTLVLATRPFANALEAAFLAMVLGIALKGGGGRRGGGVESGGGFGGAFGRCAWTGALVALGAWTRFTFVAFAAPSAAKVLADASFASDFSSSPPGRTGTTTTTKARRTTFAGSSHGSSHGAHGGSTAAGRSSRRRFRPARCLAACVCFAGSFALAALACACADTRYFRGPDAVVRVFRVVFEAARETVVKLSTAGVFFGAGGASSSTVGPSSSASASLASALAFAKDTLVIPPMNAFLYNADAANLATHGIHPRATHALLNAPLAFGPTALFAYAALAGATRKTARAALERGFLFLRGGGGARRRDGSNGRGGGGVKSPGGGSSSSDTLRRARDARLLLAWSFWLPLLVLSAAPHQELRFLLPALVPLSALHGASALKTNARVLAWAAFNLAAVAVFGAAHQAGVAPAVAAIPRLLAEHVTRVESNRMESRMERGTSAAAAAAAAALEDVPTLDAAFSTVPGADAFAADATRGALDGTLDGTTLDGTLDGTLSAPPRDPPRVTPRVVFYRTYPPPVSLAGEPASGWFGRDAIVTDLMGARADVAADALRAEGCLRDLKRFGRDSDDDGVCATLLVAPRPAAEEALAALERMRAGGAAGAGEEANARAGTEKKKEKGGGFGAVPRATRVWRYPGPHFSGEEVEGLIAALGAGDAEGVARAMTLDVYAVEAGA